MGQKATTGEMRRPEDMIFDPLTGDIPDVVMNPHSMRRNTQGFVPTMMHAATVLLTGEQRPELCDAFAETEEQLIERVKGLLLPGARDMRRVMVDGRTGEALKCRVLVGYKGINSLKQIAQWKTSVRGPRGPRQIMNRQPTQGRLSQGGLRWGTQV